MSAKWAKGWVLAPFLFLGVACGSSDPSTATLPTQTSNARTNPDNQEVQDTGCDKPASTVKEATNQIGDYRAKLELRHSDNPEARCKGLIWLRLTPVTLPPSPKDKEFAAVLYVGSPDDKTLPQVARQDARPSDATVELITKGHLVKSGQQVQGCLSLLTEDGQLNQTFTCTVPYTAP